MDAYLSGARLYGEDLTPPELQRWFDTEKEATSDLRGKEWKYQYHALNMVHGFQFLPPANDFSPVLSFGGGDGSELLPIRRRISDVIILEPSDQLKPAVPARMVKPLADGRLPFPDEYFQLVTCFGVLHHLPKVSFAIRELCRVMRPRSFALITEPVISMGDWRNPRPGLSPNERGIPSHILRSYLDDVGFTILEQRPCMFSLVQWLNRKFGTDCFNSYRATYADYLLSRLPFPQVYHAQKPWQKVRPIGMFYVLLKV